MEIINGTLNDATFHLFDEVLDEVYGSFPQYRNFVQKVNPHRAYQYHVVLEDGKAIARCVSYINEEIIYKDEYFFLFGNFECIHDQKVANFLLDEVEKVAREHAKNVLIGPISGSTWYDYRIALPSTNPVFFTEFFTPPYYKEILNVAGFSNLASYKSTHASHYEVDEKKLEKCRKMFEEKGIVLRPIDLNNFEKELEYIFQLSLEGFKNNFLYSSITREEFFEKYLPLKQIAHPSTIYLAFEADTCVGFTMSIANMYNKKQLVMKSAARLPGFKYNGLGTYFNEITKKGAKEMGYEELIVAFLIDDGVSERTFSNANDNEAYREYEILMRRF